MFPLLDGVNARDKEKTKIWLKPRNRSVHPNQQEPSFPLKRPEDEEIALLFTQNGFRLSNKDAFSTLTSSHYLRTPNTSSIPSFPALPALMSPNISTGNNGAATVVTLKPRIPSSRRVTSVERIIIHEKANSSSSIGIIVLPELPSVTPKSPCNGML